jgi:hypothetical protein
MMTVTPAARERLADALDQMDEQVPDDACFRIVQSEDNQLTLALGVPSEEDVKIEQSEKTVLAMSPDVAALCEDRTLDIEESGPDGKQVLTLT